MTYGRGALVQSERSPRTDVPSSQIEHFIAFITRAHIVFEDLADVVERLGDTGLGMGWTKDTQICLRAAKRYLKSD